MKTITNAEHEKVIEATGDIITEICKDENKAVKGWLDKNPGYSPEFKEMLADLVSLQMDDAADYQEIKSKAGDIVDSMDLNILEDDAIYSYSPEMIEVMERTEDELCARE